MWIFQEIDVCLGEGIGREERVETGWRGSR